MTALIEKYIDTEKIREISKIKNFDEPTYLEYIRFLEKSLKDDEKYSIKEEDYEVSTLKYVNDYIDEFISEKQKGFSIEWVKEFVYNKLYEDNRLSSSLAYWGVKQIDPVQAKKDLELYVQLTKRDELFVRYFEYLIEIDVPNVTPSPEQQADNYCRIYKEQILKDKSDVFANKYAELKAQGKYGELGCYAEAAEYEKAILEGCSKEYAKRFSFDIAEYIANYCSSYKEALEDEEEFVEMERERLYKLYKTFQ